MTSNLVLRILSAAVLAPLAVGAAWLGGWGFAIFWAAAAIAVIIEWIKLVGVRNVPWVACGFVYGAVMFVAPVFLRNDPVLGFQAIIFLFIVVWATDIVAYFAGRALGGPKLAISISPNKTWSGAIVGTAAAIAIAIPFAKYLGQDQRGIALLALVLSIAAQIGDLLESALKRRFNAKDASQLIPGHGGVMDRLDGFWAAALVAAGTGVARGGFHGAQGLLAW
jgi:phosphatidate cytidylyltransferase